MNLNRLFSQGRISEIFGAEVLPIDKYFRTLGLNRVGKKFEKSLPSETKEILQAYANGVNEAVNQMKILPIEFYFLGINFTQWTVYDTLTVYKLAFLQ